MSHVDDIALVDDDTACVTNSFDFQVHCVARSGTVVGVFGQEGDGPGEFRSAGRLERAAPGAVGVLDSRLGRVSVFTPGGTLLSEHPMPRNFSASQLVGDRVFGLTMDFTTINSTAVTSALKGGGRQTQADAIANLFAPAEASLRDGDVRWSRPGLADETEAECVTVASAAATPAGGLVFWTCDGDMVMFEDRDGPALVLQPPGRIEELPSDRDVQDYLDGMARIGGGNSLLPEATREAYVARYRRQPKQWYLTGGLTFRFDHLGRTWAATSHDRELLSYIEVWDGAVYARMVAVRDRLLGFDLHGNTLVTLVERAADVDGVAPRVIDWYEVPGP